MVHTCHGSFASKSSFISGTGLNAGVIIVDPQPNFVLDCDGISSCEGLYIQIQLTLPNDLFIISKINCNAEKACES